MVYGFKPQGKNRSIQANTRNPPQDPPPPPKPITDPVIIKSVPQKVKKVTKPIVKKVTKPIVKVEKVIVQKKPLTIIQKIIRLFKRVVRK